VVAYNLSISVFSTSISVHCEIKSQGVYI
jgi:hypothetical protein